MARKNKNTRDTGSPTTQSETPSTAVKAAPATAAKPASSPPPAPAGGDEFSTAARLAILAVLAYGLFAAGYLTYGHIALVSGYGFECAANISDKINCDLVNTSEYSELFGLPVALYAIPTYLVLAFLVFRSLGRRGEDQAVPLSFATGIALLTVLHSAAMAYLSAVKVGAVCLFCISLYVVNLVTFGLSWYASRRSLGQNLSRVLSGLSSRPGLAGQAALVLLLTFGVALAGTKGLEHRMLEASKKALGTDQPVVGGAGAAGADTGLIDPDDATYGPKDAKVTVVEFADFQCGYCKRMSYAVKGLKDEFGDRVLFVFKHFPMSPKCNTAVKNDKHPYACDAARAGICATRMGKFWEFHDLTFKNQRNLKIDDLLTYGEKVGLDPGELRQCLQDPSVTQAIAADIEDSRPFAITGTPRIIINGKQFRGIVPQAVLADYIRQQLGEGAGAGAPVAGGPETDGGEEGGAADEAAAGPVADPAQSPEMIELSFGGKAFLIDAFEAGRGEGGRPASAANKVPLNRSSWYDAKAACESVGKRTCTQEEWIAACQNAAVIDDDKDGKLGDDLIEGTEFSYSDFYQGGLCNDGQKDAAEGRVALTGNFPRCRTPTGVYDLNGNVQEWVGESEDKAVLLGGNYYDGEKASCFRIQDTFGPGFANKATGFRCCKDK